MSTATASTSTSSPNSNLIYLFALGSAGVATGLQFVADNIILYMVVVALGAIAGMIVTRAGFGKATLAFLLTGVVSGLLYYFVVAKMLAGAGEVAAAAAANESAETRALAAATAEAGADAIGILVAALAFIQTFVPGFLGSAIGALVRPKQRKAASRASQPVMA
jgi:hypothetical protein